MPAQVPSAAPCARRPARPASVLNLDRIRRRSRCAKAAALEQQGSDPLDEKRRQRRRAMGTRFVSGAGEGRRGKQPSAATARWRGPLPEPFPLACNRLSSLARPHVLTGSRILLAGNARRPSAQQDREIERTERAEDRKGRDSRREGSLCVFVGHGPAPFLGSSRSGGVVRLDDGCKRTRRCRRTVRSVRGQRETCKRRCRVGPGGGDPPPYCLPEGIRLRRRRGQGAAHGSSIAHRENMSRVHSGRRLRQMVDGPPLRRGRAMSSAGRRNGVARGGLAPSSSLKVASLVRCADPAWRARAGVARERRTRAVAQRARSVLDQAELHRLPHVLHVGPSQISSCPCGDRRCRRSRRAEPPLRSLARVVTVRRPGVIVSQARAATMSVSMSDLQNGSSAREGRTGDDG